MNHLFLIETNNIFLKTLISMYLSLTSLKLKASYYEKMVLTLVNPCLLDHLPTSSEPVNSWVVTDLFLSRNQQELFWLYLD